MSPARKTLAKYGAKIPTARSTGAKVQPGKPDAPVEPLAKAEQVPRKSGDKKR
jgi:hypothetical protein